MRPGILVTDRYAHGTCERDENEGSSTVTNAIFDRHRVFTRVRASLLSISVEPATEFGVDATAWKRRAAKADDAHSNMYFEATGLSMIKSRRLLCTKIELSPVSAHLMNMHILFGSKRLFPSVIPNLHHGRSVTEDVDSFVDLYRDEVKLNPLLP